MRAGKQPGVAYVRILVWESAKSLINDHGRPGAMLTKGYKHSIAKGALTAVYPANLLIARDDQLCKMEVSYSIKLAAIFRQL